MYVVEMDHNLIICKGMADGKAGEQITVTKAIYSKSLLCLPSRV